MQLWIALPDSARDVPRGFDHYAPKPVSHCGAEVTVFLGSLAGQRSPVRTHTPLLGAQLALPPRGSVELDVDHTFEHGLILDEGNVQMSGAVVRTHQLAYQGPGAHTLQLQNIGSQPARVVLLGGEPFTDELVMWWNFLGRSHEDIIEYRRAWQEQSDRFGRVIGYQGAPERLPAPPLPTTRLKPRRIAIGNQKTTDARRTGP